MKKPKIVFALLATLALSGCGKSAVECSSTEAKAALETAIREGLEKSAIERVKAEDGSQPISTSSIRASIANIKLIIENIRTTKEDPNSTKRFCTGSLKIVFTPETLAAASRARELVNLSNVEKMADDANVEKGADYLKTDLDYNVQPTDDGKRVFAEFEDASSKLDVFGEVVAASLLKSQIEAQVSENQQQAEAAQKEQEAALGAARSANLEQANLAYKTAEQALNVMWQAIDSETKKGLLAQQRVWLKQRDANCKVEGIQSSTDSAEQKLSELQCKANYNNERTSQLQNYVSSGY